MASVAALADRVAAMEAQLLERDKRIAALEKAIDAAEAAAGGAPEATTTGRNGMPTLVLRGGNSVATVYLHGAHVTSWTVGGVEQLFCSKSAVFKPPKAIR